VFGFDTDVNAAALAMAIHFSDRKGSDGEVTSLAYCTVGTGVGVGILTQNQLIHGHLHPEGGHVYVPRAPGDSKEEFEGTCPYHGDCLEGLVASAALAKRKQIPARELASLSDDDDLWKKAAFYLAHMSVMLSCTVSPQVIVIGGGIMQREVLFHQIRTYATQFDGGYLGWDYEKVIQPSPFGQDAGIIGAATLGLNALQKASSSQ